MFQPLRFNKMLKAIPGLAHLQLTPKAAHQASSKTYTHVQERIEVDKLQGSKDEVKATHIREKVTEDVSVHIDKGGKKTTEVRKHITEDIDVKKVQRNSKGVTEVISHVHATTIGVAEIEMTPPHLPREETPTYSRTHHHLVYTLDTPCAICGVRNSTLKDPKENPFNAQAIETHHYPIERSLLNACDHRKIKVIFPQVKDRESLEEFIDSEANMMVLCDVHHRHPHYGIHHLLAQDFFIQPFLFGGYQIVAEAEEVEKVRIANERIVNRHTKK